MKIKKEMRNPIFDAYEQVINKLRGLQDIVRNEIELTDVDMSIHKNDSKELCELIMGLHYDIKRNILLNK